MTDEFPSGFKFNDDEQEPESFYQEELKDLRVEKLSQRVTLLSILLPCLVAVAIYFGYRDLSGRVSRGYDTESIEVQRLSRQLENLAKDFNDRLITFSTTLSTQDKDLGNTLDDRLAAISASISEMQKNVKSLSGDQKKIGEIIERLNASKVDKKSQALEIEKINAALTPLKAELDKLKTVEREVKRLSDDIANLEGNLTKQLTILAASTEQSKRDYEQIQDSLTKLSGKTVDQDTVALEVFKLKKYFESQIAKEVSNLNRRMDSLKKKIDGIEKISKSQRESLNKVSQKSAPAQPAAAEDSGSVSKTIVSPPGTIVEKDLIE